MTESHEFRWAVMDQDARDAFRMQLAVDLMREAEAKAHLLYGDEPNPLLEMATTFWAQAELLEGIHYATGLLNIKRTYWRDAVVRLARKGIYWEPPKNIQHWIRLQTKKWSFTKEAP